MMMMMMKITTLLRFDYRQYLYATDSTASIKVDVVTVCYRTEGNNRRHVSFAM